jgi:hypothetical protein
MFGDAEFRVPAKYSPAFGDVRRPTMGEGGFLRLDGVPVRFRVVTTTPALLVASLGLCPRLHRFDVAVTGSQSPAVTLPS